MKNCTQLTLEFYLTFSDVCFIRSTVFEDLSDSEPPVLQNLSRCYMLVYSYFKTHKNMLTYKLGGDIFMTKDETMDFSLHCYI